MPTLSEVVRPQLEGNGWKWATTLLAACVLGLAAVALRTEARLRVLEDNFRQHIDGCATDHSWLRQQWTIWKSASKRVVR
jgi:hypothetical protein